MARFFKLRGQKPNLLATNSFNQLQGFQEAMRPIIAANRYHSGRLPYPECAESSNVVSILPMLDPRVSEIAAAALIDSTREQPRHVRIIQQEVN